MAQFSLSAASNLFKIKYGKLSDNVYNSYNVVLGRVKKNYDFTGKQKFIAVPTSFSGGVGSGSLPQANYANYEGAIITAKKMYAVVQIEREAIKASMNNEGAFVQGTKEVIQKGVESYMRNASRALFHDGSGSLGQFSGNAAGTATSPVLTITAASWHEAQWEEKDFVNVNTLGSVWEVVEVDPVAKTVELLRISGSDDLTAIGAGTHTVYMQNSRNADPQGLLGVLDATAGSLYNIPVSRRWKAGSNIDATGAGLTTDVMNEAMLEVQRKSGKVPNMIVTSFTQYRKLLNILEDQKQYNIDPRSAELKGKVSFKGVEFMSAQGAVGVFPERFCQEDRMYFLNDNYIEMHHRPDFGWFEDDGTVFLRDATDSYSARYGGYYETYIVPSFHGVVKGLAV